jgi:hypothetical protein
LHVQGVHVIIWPAYGCGGRSGQAPLFFIYSHEGILY